MTTTSRMPAKAPRDAEFEVATELNSNAIYKNVYPLHCETLLTNNLTSEKFRKT